MNRIGFNKVTIGLIRFDIIVISKTSRAVLVRFNKSSQPDDRGQESSLAGGGELRGVYLLLIVGSRLSFQSSHHERTSGDPLIPQVVEVIAIGACPVILPIFNFVAPISPKPVPAVGESLGNAHDADDERERGQDFVPHLLTGGPGTKGGKRCVLKGPKGVKDASSRDPRGRGVNRVYIEVSRMR